jgi:hypothetical protein
MSRTTLARNEKRVDYYPTPAWCVHRLLEACQLPGGRWLEPAVGDGAIVRAVNAVRSDVTWTTVDVRVEVDPDHVGDFWAFGGAGLVPEFPAPYAPFSVAITNPPYSQALEFVVAARGRARVVAMLLRLGWLSSAERAPFLRDWMPDVYVLPDRPSFDGQGSDSADYAWLVWQQKTRGSWGRAEVLATTPIGERRAHE